MRHKHKGDSDQDYHYIRVTKGTLLHKIINEERYKVNSHHHQAVRQLGRDLVVNAVAEDGVIEGIEHTDRRFCVGVEWHPEYQRNSQDKELINHFIKSCI